MLTVILENRLVKKKIIQNRRTTAIVYPDENRGRDWEEAVCTKLILST